jgi:ABC-type polysaccharide/polyol phosphate transport system ATPase subunit
MTEDIAISVSNLSKNYSLRSSNILENKKVTNDFTALNNVSVDIRKGESVAIVGANGSGKSTLLKILAGVTKPSSGSVTLNGRVASILDIGSGFHPELSGRENIFLNGQLLGFNKKEIQSKVDEIGAFSGVGHFINEPVKNYSNGMFLRLAFSIVVHLDFDIYLFDEVLGVGDAEFIVKSKSKIRSLIESEKTVVMVSHNLYDLTSFDLYIEIQKGQILQLSNKANVISKYLTKAIGKANVNVHESSINYIGPEDANKYFKLDFVNFDQPHQKTNRFSSNFPFILKIGYTKISTKETIDVILTISDSTGTVILVSSPIVTGAVSESKESGKAIVSCEIPDNFFNSNIYSIGLAFVANANSIKRKSEKINLVNQNVDTLFGDYRVIKTYRSLFYFKVNVKMPGFLDTGELDFSTGMLLPSFKWEVKQSG